MSLSEEEIRLQGTAVSEGIAFGYLFFLPSYLEDPILEHLVSDIPEEILRYRRALEKSRTDFAFLECGLQREGSREAFEILDTQIQMLSDPLLTVEVEEKIIESGKNAEFVFSQIIREYEKKFSKIKDSFFQQRIVDILDLSRRILGHLIGKTRPQFIEIPQNSIVFARDLIPSHTAAIQTNFVDAFVTHQGGGSSHAALIARSKGIPYISGIDIHKLKEFHCRCAIVNGTSGEIILQPTSKTLENYREMKTRLKTTYQLLQQDIHPITETFDGFLVHVYANIGSIADIEEMHVCKSDGIGLFRSEYLFLEKRSSFLIEDEQTKVYHELACRAKNLSITFRVFDIGGDKNPDLFLEYEKEINPFLGCRGIRFLLKHPMILRTQLRSIIKATLGKNIKILLPLVSDLQEIIEARKIIYEVEEELSLETHLKVGCMIEVPSVAMMIDSIVKHVDFLSIGSNDLVQYTLGMDRSNPAVTELFYPAHPSVIRMIKMVVLEAIRHDIPVTICGEMASDPLFIPLLLGLGLSQFSCSPRYIPAIKRTIRKCSLLEVFDLASEALQKSSWLEIQDLLQEYAKKS